MDGKEATVLSKPTPGSVLLGNLADVPIRQQGLAKSVLVEPFYMYPHKGETRRSKRRHHQSVIRQVRLERIRLERLGNLPDWRIILNNLVEWTSERSPTRYTDAVKIILPEDTVHHFVHGPDSSIWAIRQRTGCDLKLSERSEEDGASSLVLSGTERSLYKCVDEVLHITKRAVVVQAAKELGFGTAVEEPVRENVSDPLQSSAIVRTSWFMDEAKVREEDVYRPYVLTISANDIPKPPEWTKKAFEKYVAALTNGRPPPHLVSSLYPCGTSHEDVVINLLHAVFRDEETRPSLSTSAFKMALAFMARSGYSHRLDARALFTRMEMFGLRMDTEVFNILLRSTVKEKDLRGFGRTLRIMHRRGYPLKMDTWIQFLRMFTSEEVKRYILHAMNSKGLLNSSPAVRQVAKEMVPFDIDRAMQQNLSLSTFLSHQETRYGPRWLSQGAGNKIVEVLGRYGKFADCGSFIDIMLATRNARPDIVTFNTVLTHCKVQGSLRAAIAVMKHMEKAPDVVPDAITYHLLFEMAWKGRLLHVVGVIWRYSSLTRLSSHRMRLRATQALLGKKKLVLLKMTKAIIGRDALRQHTVQPRPEDKPFSNTFAGTAASKWYATQYEGWEPVVPLGVMLQEALDRDKQRLRDRREGRAEKEYSLAIPLKRKKDEHSDGPLEAEVEDDSEPLIRRVYMKV